MRDKTPLYIAVVALGLAGFTWQRGGFALVFEGLKSGGKILLEVTPLLIAAFLIAGLIQTLVTRELVTKWLGDQSGWRGIFLACLGGGLIPGGPYAYYPIAAALLHSGGGLGVLVAFVTAKNLWAFSRLPLEVALLGSQLTFLRFGITFLFPPLLGFLAEKLFGGYVKRIREATHAQ